MNDSRLQILRRGIFLVSIPVFFINFAIPVQARQLGASAVEIGALFSLFTLCLLLLRPLIGYGLDRFGRRPFFITALLAYTIANGLFAFAGDLTAMYLARFMQGVGGAMLIITVDTITTDLTGPGDRLVEMGRNVEVASRANIVGATVGFSLVASMPQVALKYSFFSFCMAAALGFLLAIVQLPESRSAGHRAASRAYRFQLAPALKRLMVIIFMAGFGNALIMPIYLIYLQDSFTMAPDRLAVAFLPAGIVFAILPSKLGRLTGHWGNVNVLAFGLCLAGTLHFVLPHLPAFFAIVLIFTLSSVGWAMVEPARKALVGMLGDVNATGRTFGVTELYAGLGAFLGPLAGGYVYDAYGAMPAFYMNGALVVSAGLLALVLLKAAATPARQ